MQSFQNEEQYLETEFSIALASWPVTHDSLDDVTDGYNEDVDQQTCDKTGFMLDGFGLLDNYHHHLQQRQQLFLSSSPPVVPQESFSLILQSYRDLDYLFGTGSSSIKQQISLQDSTHSDSRTSSTEITVEQDVVYEDRDDENTKSSLGSPSLAHLVDVDAFIDVVMSQALSHWCCIGFKVAPVSLEYIRDWNSAAIPIRYCVAAITMVSLQRDSIVAPSFAKDGALSLYYTAREQIEGILFEQADDNPILIQSFFCLCYTSNLLRLYRQRHAWSSLAAISLRQLVRDKPAIQKHTKVEIDPTLFLCWSRWYYIDAWMCLLQVQKACLLLSDDLPPPQRQQCLSKNVDSDTYSNAHVRQMATLGHCIRRFIRVWQNGLIRVSSRSNVPSTLFYELLADLQSWYEQLPPWQQRQQYHHHPHHNNDQNTLISSCTSSSNNNFKPPVNIHLYLCYHAARLMFFYEFIRPGLTYPPPESVLAESLETSTCLLLGLQYLADIGCDQSTYHHLFLVIHNSSRRVHFYARQGYAFSKILQRNAEIQLLFNVALLRNTIAYQLDTFNIRTYAAKCEKEVSEMNISLHTSQDDDHGTSDRRPGLIPIFCVRRQQNTSPASPSTTFSIDKHCTLFTLDGVTKKRGRKNKRSTTSKEE